MMTSVPERSLSPSECRAAIGRAVSPAGRRTLCLMGPSGAGKTTTLRETLHSRGVESRWAAARDVVDGMVEALRADGYEPWLEAATSEPRALVLEHAEDLRGRPRTMEELRRLFDRRLSRRHPVIVTLTPSAACDDVVAWLRQYADVIRMRRPRRHRVADCR